MQESCLWIGDSQRREFADVLHQLRSRFRVVLRSSTWAQSLKDGRIEPRLIVLAQAYPGQISPELVQRCAVLWPEAQRFLLAGGWCDGEFRSGQPVGGIPRLSSLAAGWSLAGSVPNGLVDGQSGGSRAPDETELTAPLSARGPNARLRGCAAVVTHDPMLAAALTTALFAGGWIGVWAAAPSGLIVERPSVIVIDLARSSEARDAQLRETARWYAAVPVVGLADFPRFDEVQGLRDAGLSHVLAKPFRLDDLLALLGLVTSRPLC
jgi:hypothetical protein